MLFMQFLAAIAANHLQYRRKLWMTLSILQRVLYVPVAAGPWLWPQISDGAWIWALLGVMALEQGLLHFCTPLWLSWMGDYLPHRGLSTYWGVRHLWMQWTAALALFGQALLMHHGGMDVRQGFAIMVAIGAVLGVIDIVMFLRVPE